MFKLLSLLLQLVKSLINATVDGWTMLAKNAPQKVKDGILISLTVALLLELFWLTFLITFWLLWQLVPR